MDEPAHRLEVYPIVLEAEGQIRPEPSEQILSEFSVCYVAVIPLHSKAWNLSIRYVYW